MRRLSAHTAFVTAFVAIVAIFCSPRTVFGVEEIPDSYNFQTLHVAYNYVFTPSESSEIPTQIVESESIRTLPVPTNEPQIVSSRFEKERIVPTEPVPIATVQPAPLPTIFESVPQAVPTVPTEIERLIDTYAQEYGADPQIMKIIAKCESGFNPQAVSPSGAYVGLFQFVAGTWISNRNAMGLDPDPSLRSNAEESIRTAAFKMGRDGYGAWPVCGK